MKRNISQCMCVCVCVCERERERERVREQFKVTIPIQVFMNDLVWHKDNMGNLLQTRSTVSNVKSICQTKQSLENNNSSSSNNNNNLEKEGAA